MKRILILLMLLMMVSKASAEQATFTWDANAEPDLAGYKLYWGGATGNYSDVRNTGLVTLYTLAPIDPGTYFFALTAFDATGNESGKSTELEVEILNVNPPAAPQNFNFVSTN